MVHECLVTRHKAFGKDSFFVNFVKLILGNGLLTNDGESHLRQRRLIQPGFHRDRILAYGEIMAACAASASDRWKDGQTVNILFEMSELTLDIVGKTLFNSNVRDDAAKVSKAIETIIARGDIFLLPMFPRLLELPLPWNRSFHEAIETLDGVLYRIIEDHRATGDQGDLLSILLAAQYEDGQGGMSNEQIRDEALTLFTAGHETTAIALTWTWRLLAEHPDVERRLHDELDEILGGNPPVPADYPRLEYTQRVFREALRLYPPTLMVGRQAREATEIGGFSIPKGALVIMTPYVTHRDPTIFPEPERFNPDRWLQSANTERGQMAFFPFGGGQRRCIGESFAWMEGVLVLASLAQCWRLRTPPDFELALDPRLTMRPKGGFLPMVLERRNSVSAR